MVEWQLPKLHTRVRFPSPAFMLQNQPIDIDTIEDWESFRGTGTT